MSTPTPQNSNQPSQPASASGAASAGSFRPVSGGGSPMWEGQTYPGFNQQGIPAPNSSLGQPQVNQQLGNYSSGAQAYRAYPGYGQAGASYAGQAGAYSGQAGAQQPGAAPSYQVSSAQAAYGQAPGQAYADAAPKRGKRDRASAKNSGGNKHSGGKKKAWIIALIIVLVLLIAGVIGAIVWREHVQQQKAEDALAHRQYPITFEINAENYDPEEASPIPLHITGTTFEKTKVDKKVLYQGDSTDIKLMRGSYQVQVEASPVLPNGTIYSIPEEPASFEITGPATLEEAEAEKESDDQSEEASGSAENSDAAADSESSGDTDTEASDTEGEDDGARVAFLFEPVAPEDVTNDQINQIELTLADYGLEQTEAKDYAQLVLDTRQEKLDQIAAEKKAAEEEAARKAAEEEAARRAQAEAAAAQAAAEAEAARRAAEESQFVGGMAKPVIYLYPQKPTQIAVKLHLIQGELTTTYPKYKNGWSVLAQPDGTLTDASGKGYNYLFWEAKDGPDWDFSQGFVVAGADAADFLEEALPKLGLNRREANDFIVYWLPKLEANKWNLVSFQGKNYTDNAQLTVTPKPQTSIRVFMAMKAIDHPVAITQQKLTAPERTGYTLVEWGGWDVK